MRGIPGRRLTSAVAVIVAMALAVLGVSAAVTAPVAQAADGAISFVSAAASSANSKKHTVTIPSSVRTGDLMVLALALNTDSAITAPSGWTRLESANGTGMDGQLWSRQASAADAGKQVTATSTVQAKGTLSLAVYRSSAGTASVSAHKRTIINKTTATLTTPSVSVTASGSWLVSVVAYRAGSAAKATLPTGMKARSTSNNSGSKVVGATVADSNGVVATGNRGGATVRMSRKVARGITYSIVVKPGSTPVATNRAPVASFTASCAELTCQVDASGSSDPDGDDLTYAWSFGDSSTGAGVTTSHTYAAAGTRTITLSVKDAQATTTATKSVTLTVTAPTGTLPGHPRLVSDTALTNQPKITTGEIRDLAYLGDRVFIAGTFTSISNNTGTSTTSYNQPYLASWNRVTGLVDTGFRPVFDRDVTDIELSPDGTKLFVAGRFNTVNGVTKRKFASINPVTGATVTSWTANADAAGTELAATNTAVFLGGQFTKINGVDKHGLAAVDATTGSLLGSTAANPAGTWSNDISGGIGVDGALNVQEMLLTPDLSKLIVVHTGRQIAGQDRYGVGIIGVATGQLLPWRTRLWEDNLGYVGGVQRAYGGAMSPDGKSFYVSSGSGGDRPPINDTLVKLPVAGNDFVEPIWVARCFDSVYSVAASEQAVYIGGHFSWNESQTSRDPWPGLDDVGYGTGQGLSGYGLGDEVLRRDHLGALDPEKGKGVDWNPGSNSFEGNKAMLVTPWGLVTGGDGTTQGGSNVGRIAVFNLLSAPSTTYETTITEPVEGRVEVAGQQFTATGTAHAVSGVKNVQVTIRDRGTGNYLQSDLTTWAATSANLSATLAAPNAVDSTWSLPLTLTGNLDLEISARTVAVNGNRDETKEVNKFETFSTTDKTPTATITGPSGVVPSTTFTVTGTATDDFGVRSIGYVVKDASNRFLQDDGTVSTTYNSFSVAPDVVDGTSTTWSTELTVPSEGQWMIAVTPRDNAGQSSLDTYNRTWIVSSTGVAPSVTIQSPVVMNPPAGVDTFTVSPGSALSFSGTATDDENLATVEIQLRNTTTGEAVASDGTWGVQRAGWYRISAIDINGKSTTWSYTTPFNLTPGSYSFSVRATDDLGLSTSSSNQGRLSMNAQIPGDNPPDGLLDVTGTISGLQSLALTLTGTATDDFGVASVKVALRDADTNRYVQPDGTMGAAFATLAATLASPGGTSTTWSLTRTLPTEGDWRVTAYAYDTAGQQDTSTTGATASYPIYPGDVAPYVVDNLHSPTDGAVFTDGRIIVSGRVEDDRQIAGAQVAIVNSVGQYMSSSGSFSSTSESWRSAFLNSPGSPGSNYSYTTPVLPAGDYTVRVRGVDNHGFTTTPSVDAVVTVQVPASNPPVASFTVACGVTPNRANTCAFDARGTTDENPTAVTYAWSFGNGSGSGAVVNRTYTAAGTYTVTLTAKDEWGNVGTATQTVTIAEPADNTAPTMLAIDTPACNALSCSLVGRFRDNLGDSTSRVWVWGDNTTNGTSSGTVSGTGDQLVTTSHTFAAAGTYIVTLTVTDGWGRPTSVTKSVTVTG